MNSESALKSAVWFFVIVVIGALLSAALGGGFGAVIAVISPEFVQSLFGHEGHESATRYALAVGMIWGLFIGAAVSGFACLLAAAIRIFRIRFEYRKQREAGDQRETTP